MVCSEVIHAPGALISTVIPPPRVLRFRRFVAVIVVVTRSGATRWGRTQPAIATWATMKTSRVAAMAGRV
jgi:hypothetical protein